MAEKIIKKCKRNVFIRGATYNFCQLGFVDPYSDRSLADLTVLFYEAKKDFPDIDPETVYAKVFGSELVPESVGIAFFVPVDTTIPGDYC